MLLVKTTLGKSKIHGLGVFAAEFIAKGTRIWRYVEGYDRCWTPRQFAKLPKPARDYLEDYAYQVDGEIIFTVDNDHYINHSVRPNTYLKGGYAIAKRAIRKGAEITNDYREFEPVLCAAFLRRPATKKRGGRTQRASRAASASSASARALSPTSR